MEEDSEEMIEIEEMDLEEMKEREMDLEETGKIRRTSINIRIRYYITLI